MFLPINPFWNGSRYSKFEQNAPVTLVSAHRQIHRMSDAIVQPIGRSASVGLYKGIDGVNGKHFSLLFFTSRP